MEKFLINYLKTEDTKENNKKHEIKIPNIATDTGKVNNNNINNIAQNKYPHISCNQTHKDYPWCLHSEGMMSNIIN